MLRGNKEASPSARLEASSSAPSQSRGARVERNTEKSKCRDPSATDVLHDLGCVTSTAPCHRFPPGESAARRAGRACVAVRAFASARAVCLHVRGGDVSLPSVCRRRVMSLCRGGR